MSESDVYVSNSKNESQHIRTHSKSKTAAQPRKTHSPFSFSCQCIHVQVPWQDVSPPRTPRLLPLHSQWGLSWSLLLPYTSTHTSTLTGKCI